MRDKPPAAQRRPLLTDRQVDQVDHAYRTRLESLLSVDEAIEKIISALAERGELHNTYIFYTSDNGYHLGQHRLLWGKGQIYEEDIRVPLIVRGPGVPRGQTRDHFVLNIDFAPTFVDLAEATAGISMDGRSLLPLLGNAPPAPPIWRQDFLVEIYTQPTPLLPLQEADEIRAVRTRDWIYAEYLSGARELYDLRADPYQLQSRHASASPDLIEGLSVRLRQLATCAGATCQQ
jgi:arylsulfatase A-like enzyme